MSASISEIVLHTVLPRCATRRRRPSLRPFILLRFHVFVALVVVVIVAASPASGETITPRQKITRNSAWKFAKSVKSTRSYRAPSWPIGLPFVLCSFRLTRSREHRDSPLADETLASRRVAAKLSWRPLSLGFIWQEIERDRWYKLDPGLNVSIFNQLSLFLP